jgi:hypothetical protein
MAVGIMQSVDTDRLLGAWENAIGQPPWIRDEILLAASGPAAPPRTLGERNARLMELHARLFGRDAELLSHCPTCGAVVQFAVDSQALALQMTESTSSSTSHQLETAGHLVEFRLPEGSDVAAASAEPTEDEFARHMLRRCVLACTRDAMDVATDEMPASVLDAVSQRMEQLDPGAHVSFALRCPHCAAAWDAQLDIGHLVWQKVQAAAERLLVDVDSLARAYGWTEAEVLRLSPVRRAAYLQMVTA